MRTVPEIEAAKPASSHRRDWADLLFGRTLPALFFGLFIVIWVLGSIQTAGRLTQAGATADDYLAFANRVLRLAFFSMLVVMYVVRLPTRKADRRPFVILVSFVGTFCVVATGFLPASPHGPGSVLI